MSIFSWIQGCPVDRKRDRSFALQGELLTAQLHIDHLKCKLADIDHLVDWNGYANVRQTIEEWNVEVDRLTAALEKLK